jgi:hypothetical protein
MSRLITDKLHTTFLPGVSAQDPVTPRRYTLTHSDYTGEIFLTIGEEYNLSQLKSTYLRFLRDEVLGEWQVDQPFALHIYCHISGGFVIGTAAMRYSIFKRKLPLALESLRYGDRRLFAAHPYLDSAPILIHFTSTDPRYEKTELFGTPSDYNIRNLKKMPVGR